MAPIGTAGTHYKLTDFCLSKEALEVVQDWVAWLLTDAIATDGILHMFRDDLANAKANPP